MLKEINQTDKFMTLIEADFRDADFIYKNYTFKDKHLKTFQIIKKITKKTHDFNHEMN